MTELALLRRWTDRRDAAALKEIVSRYAPMVYATCRRILRNSADAEDVAQECFETLVRTQQGPTEHLGSWLHRVATNRALDRVRSEQRRRVRESEFAADQPTKIEPARDDVHAHVDEAIADLPEELRVAVVAHYLEGRSHGAIARATGVPRRTVSHRIARGVGLIGESLAKRGVVATSATLAALLAATVAEATSAPATLTAALGKLALAQSANAGAVGTPTVAAAWKAAAVAIGGLAMKKAIAGLVIIGAVLVGIWVMTTFEHDGALGNEVDEASNPPSAEAPASRHAAMPPAPVEQAAAPEDVANLEAESVTPGVSGVVVDAQSGEGVARATVAVVAGDGGQQPQEVVTDDEGRFDFTELRPGTYLVFKKIGPGDYTVSAPEDMLEVSLHDGRREEGLRLVARKGATIFGNVTDQHNLPIAGATVRVYPARNESFQGTKAMVAWTEHVTQTDTSGDYAFHGLTLRRSCAAFAVADGYPYARSDEFAFSAADTPRRIDFKLSRGSTISGAVQDRAGKPLPDQRIALEIVYNQGDYADDILKIFAQGEAQGITSDAKGEFRIEGLPAATYHLLVGLHCTMRRFDGGGTRVEVDGVNDVTGVVVTANSLDEGEHSISGCVTDSKGAAIADAEICIAPRNIGGIYCLRTDGEGMFVIDGLAAGVDILSAAAAGFTQEVLDQVPVDGPALNIVLEPRTPIRGRVVDRSTGQPVANTRVSVAQHDRQTRLSDRFAYRSEIIEGVRRFGFGPDEPAVSDQQGAFELAGVDPGTVKLKAERAGYATAYTDELAVPSGRSLENLEIALGRGATLDGIVRAANGSPVARASILVIEATLGGEAPQDAELRLLRATNAGQGGPYIQAVSKADGTFGVAGLADGTYWLRAIASGYAYGSVAEVEIRNSAPRHGVELTIDTGGAVDGFVTQTSVPKSDILAQVTRVGADAATAQIYSNQDGYYSIPHLAPGAWELRFVDWGRPGNTGLNIFHVEIVSGVTTRQDCDFSGWVVSGQVFGLGLEPGWQVAVLALPEGVDPEAPPDLGIDWPSMMVTIGYIYDGRYAVGEVPDGIYKMTVFRIEGDRILPKNVWQTVTIEGEDIELDLDAAEDPPVEIPVPE